MDVRVDLDYARALDEADELAHYREEFVLDEPDLTYLNGNSLGRAPKRTLIRMQRALTQEWGQRLIRAWSEGWYDAPVTIGSKIAQLIGARADECIVADSTSVNFFKLVLAALRMLRARGSRRNKIVTDDLNFPSDLYILQGIGDLLEGGLRLEVVKSPDGISVPHEAIEAAIDEDTALVTLSHTAFKSGFTYDIPRVTKAAHEAGALVLWDVSHSVGALPIQLSDCRADLAVGCTYKYLNGGPGSPAFLYIRKDLQPELGNPITGWFGQRVPFEFALDYEPARDLRRFLSGTPSILSLIAIEPSVDLMLKAGIERLRAKSVAQTEYLIALWQAVLEPLGFELASPRDSERRGSHVSLAHPEGLRIDRALVERMKIVPDFRAPDNIRMGLAPLYTSYGDIHHAVMQLRTVVTERLYEKYSTEMPTVT